MLPPLPVSASLPETWNRLCYWLSDVALFDPLIAPEANAFRAELGLAARAALSVGVVLLATANPGTLSRVVCRAQRGWPAQTRLSGFPLYDRWERQRLAPEVVEFLDAGDPPVVFTPGSANRHGGRFFGAAARACRRLGCRGVFVTRFGDQIPARLAAEVRHFARVPFGPLFARSAAVVHHGGIGTSALALAAGIPQLAMPMAYDQHDNAVRLAALGVSRTLSPRRFRGPAVARAIHSLITSRDVAGRCRSVAARVRGARPLDHSLELIEEAMNDSRRPTYAPTATCS